MKKLLTVIFSLFLITPVYAEEMSYEEFFLQVIHICKDNDLYQEYIQESKKSKDSVKLVKMIDCYCNNFKEYSEDEINRKYLMSTELGVPQMDLAQCLTKAQQCVSKIGG